MTTAAMITAKPKLWVPGDWNAFFGFGTNILVNLLTLTGLLKFVLKMPDALIYGRILPATGLMLFLSTLYYAWLAYRLAAKTGRTDVCALPSGISVPHMFVVTFVVMLPIVLKTGDPVKGWEAGLTWVFIQSFVLMIGGFIGPVVRRITPLGNTALAGSTLSQGFFGRMFGYGSIDLPLADGTRRLYGLTVLAVSLDGKPLRDVTLASWVPDVGQARRMGVVDGPALVLMRPPSEFLGLSQSVLSLAELGERTLLRAQAAGWISQAEYAATRPVKEQSMIALSREITPAMLEDPEALSKFIHARLEGSP